MNLKTIKEHLEGIPSRRLPIGKNAWLQEWEETKELVNELEKELREYLVDQDDTNFMFTASEIIKELLGEQQ